jgi:hypothetical protein
MRFHDYAEAQTTAARHAPIGRVTEPAPEEIEACLSPSSSGVTP